MSQQYDGGLITATPVTPSGPYQNSTAPGIWTLDQQAYWAKQNLWPTAGLMQPDAQFNYVTMLLHGDGTNGAQNNTFVDSSTNAFTITRNGNTTQGSFSPYGSNWSNYFNGTSAYLAAPSNSAFTLGTGDFTIEMWYNPSISYASGNGYLFDMGSNGTRIQLYLNTVYFLPVAGNSIQSATGVGMTVGQWTHVAAVRSGSTMTLYVNGTSVGSTTNSSNLTDTLFRIGSAGYTGDYFTGYISNVRVVKGTAVYTGSFTPSTTPLTAVSGTSLLTCQSNRFIDNSTNNFTITKLGSTIQRFNPFGTSTAYSTSVIGGSGYFDGSGDTLTTSTSQIIPTGSFTVECWAYVTSTAANQKFVAQGSSGAAGRFSLGIEGGNWWVQLGGDAIQTGTPIFNQWNYVAVTYNGSTITLYVNGTSIGTVSSTANAQNTTLTIGQDWNSYIVTGYVADVRISNTVRTITTPTAPYSSDGSTRLLLSMTNGAIYDNAMMNDLETVGNAQISTSVVKFGTGSMYFDGSGDYLKIPSTQNVNFGTGNFTIEFWAYWAGGSFSNYAFAFDSRSGSVPYTDGVGIATNITNGYWYLSFAGQELLTSVAATASWQHIALVRNNGVFTLYINGTSGGTYTASNDMTNTTASIGTYYARSQYYWNGYIDDLRITKGYARYTANFTPPTTAFPNTGPV